MILFCVRRITAYAYHAAVLGSIDKRVNAMIYKGLRIIGSHVRADELLATVMEVEKSNLACMEMLGVADCRAFEIPVPARVTNAIEKGPAIIISGHNLNNLKDLLEQTAGKRINIYTYGEMFPAFVYPELIKHPHLKSHLGITWHNHRTELNRLGVSMLFMTNCLMLPKDDYIADMFMSGPIRHSGTIHIERGDFSPLIKSPWGDFAEDRPATTEYTTSFNREAILSNVYAIVED